MNGSVTNTLLGIVLFFHVQLQAGAIRISFLNDDVGLPGTLSFLRDQGCRDDGVAAFQKAVARYNLTALDLDFSKFPRAKQGFYSFQSATQLLAVLPKRLCDVPHPFELNCFDTVIVLAAGQLRTGLHPDDLFGVFLSPQVETNGQMNITFAATARDAFNLSYYPWYRDVSSNCIPPSMVDSRMSLIPALYSYYLFPASTTEQNISEGAMKALRASWKRQAITFPASFQVVLCHQVSLTGHCFATTHAGLLFTSKKGCVYLEKAGGSGPFVRLDFDDEADLMAWLSAKFDKWSGTHFFVTLNDSRIEMLHVSR
jgi:hypothetical protein